MKLFVYGTLQQGYWNNRLLAGAEFLGQGVTKKPYVLYNCGFPMAVTTDKKNQALPVIGEVYKVEEQHIRSCDRLEGHPNWYERRLIKADVDGEEVDVFIYEMDDIPHHNTICNIVDNKYYRWAG